MQDVFDALRTIMKAQVADLDIKHDRSDNFYVDTFFTMKNGKRLWFGGVRINKSYVSYHLMPVYVQPKILSDMSPQLKKRMQGKSCFNFKKLDPELFAELALLTKRSLQSYRDDGYLQKS